MQKIERKIQRNNLKMNGGITLIALIVTIIVLLILAGISIATLTGDNGIITNAISAKRETEKRQIIEETKLEIIGKIMEKRGRDIQESEIKEIIEKYFTDIPEDLEDMTQVLKTKSGGYEVKLSEVINGVKIKYEIKETPIAKSTDIADSYVGYYADIDNDGTVDGIIYADMIVGNTKSGRWNNDDWSDYNVTKIEDTESVKDYVVSSKTYEGQETAGTYKANDVFGEKEVLVPAINSSGSLDRFFVMSLDNFKTDDYETFYWYYNASGNLNETIATSAIDFGEGKTKTIKEINRWNNTEYGAQNPRDLWGVIQDKIGKVEENGSVVDCKWFVPSKAEWSAFGEELGITTSNRTTVGLSDLYWSSSQRNANNAYNASFGDCSIGNGTVNRSRCVRLSATF